MDRDPEVAALLPALPRHGRSQQRVDIEHIDTAAAARERVVRFYTNRE